MGDWSLVVERSGYKMGKLHVRLEAKSEKGPRNHVRGNGMLENVTHAS